jgi:uncharacterized protein (TIGR03435 family)
MQELDDSSLLREYAERASEAAFATLVARHIDKVYSVALRHAGNPAQAEEITQAVFVILAKKAGRLHRGVILSGWLYQAARLTAVTFLRSEIRRARREQEAYMQRLLNENEPDLWRQIAPLLDAGMARLNEKDRHAIVLRFFDGKSMSEVGVVLGANEDAAKKRVGRALEKLRKFFTKRGVSSTTALIAGAISTQSIQAAPAALAKSITLIAVTKGVAASASTLTLIKGALKIMAWTKTKAAVVVFAGVLLTAGTATVTIKEIQEHRTYPWEVPKWSLQALTNTPPQVRIVPAKFPPGGMGSFDGKVMGIGQPLSSIFPHAYGINWSRTFCKVQLPTGNYDFISNLSEGSPYQALQREIERKFGLKVRRETRNTDAFLLTVRNSDAPGLKPANSLPMQLLEDSNRYRGRNCPIEYLSSFLESCFKVPVADGTGLAQNFDIDFKWNRTDPQHNSLKQALLDQLGLELVPTNMPIEMLVVEKAP